MMKSPYEGVVMSEEINIQNLQRRGLYDLVRHPAISVMG